jgi:cysteine desulfurase
MYAPKGIGALYIREGVHRTAHPRASQESGRRAGTENVLLLAVALGKAAEVASPLLPKGRGRVESSLRDYFWQRLNSFDPHAPNGHPTLRLPNTLNVSFPGRVGGEILSKLPDICASTGAACHAGDAKPSRVLTAMGYNRDRAVGTIRFSLGHPTRRDEIDTVMEQLERNTGSLLK